MLPVYVLPDPDCLIAIAITSQRGQHAALTKVRNVLDVGEWISIDEPETETVYGLSHLLFLHKPFGVQSWTGVVGGSDDL